MDATLIVSPYRISGLSRYALELSESLPEQGVQLDILEARMPAWLRWVEDIVKKFGPDVGAFWQTHPMHISMPNNQHVYHMSHAGLASSLYLTNTRHLVITVHDIIHYVFRDDPHLSTYRHQLHKSADTMALKALNKATAIIAISEYTKSQLIEHLGLPQEKIHVVYRSVNLNHFQPMQVDEYFWKRHNLDRTKRYILHLSSEEARKNVPTLIRAFAQVAKRHPDVMLLKIGRSQYIETRRQLVELVHDLGIQDRVIFIDHVSEEDLPRFYNIAEMFVLPSLYEGFGLPVLEAMACGSPVICSSLPPLSTEIAVNCGVFVDPLSTNQLTAEIDRLLNDVEMQNDLSEKGKRQAKNFSSIKEAENTLEIYRIVA